MKNTATPTRRQRNREATIQSILDTARTIMREEGVSALSMQELARRMDMRAPSLYNYFTGKMDIYDALFRLGFRLWDELLIQTEQQASSVMEEIRGVIEGYMSFALTNPELYQLCFERPVPGFVPSQESLELSFGILRRARQRVERFKSQMHTDLTTDQIINLVIAVSHGLTALHIANEPHLPMGQGRFGSLIPVALDMIEKTLAATGDTP